jgi:hypothetical protein
MNNMNPEDKPKITARLVEGHRVASGLNGNPRFPGGTLRMQTPHFQERGFDISKLYVGTLNVSIAPLSYRVVKARHTFTNVNWHPTEPAEDFSFFDVRVVCPDGTAVAGYIYYPHPDTKPEHFQQSDVLELLLPFVKGLHYGMTLRLEVPADQMVFEAPTHQNNPGHAPRRQGVQPVS